MYAIRSYYGHGYAGKGLVPVVRIPRITSYNVCYTKLLRSVDDNTIGILYEGSQAQMTFQKISIAEFINK